METKVVNIRTDAYDVYIGRSGHGQDGYFGNPFQLRDESKRQEALDRYREYFTSRMSRDHEFKSKIETLRGKTLGCFCKPSKCHGDVIAAYLNSTTCGLCNGEGTHGPEIGDACPVCSGTGQL